MLVSCRPDSSPHSAIIDLVLAGEAELAIPQLAEAIQGSRDFGSVPGLYYREQDGKIASGPPPALVDDLDSLLPPSYHLAPDLGQYFRLSLRPTILIDSGRGCPFSCEFCQATLMGDHKVRYRTVTSLVDELRRYCARYGQYEAYFIHDLFTARRSFVEEFCTAMIREHLGVQWHCRCRLDQVDPELLTRMSQAGCNMLLYGVESGSSRILAEVNKRVREGSRASVVKRVRWTVEANIFPSLSMMVGHPEETVDDLNDTMTLASDLVRLGKVNTFIQLLSVLPGTELARRYGGCVQYAGSRAPTSFSQGIEFLEGERLPEDESLIRKYPDIFLSFHNVVPRHGELDLFGVVSQAYCKLLEVYAYTFLGLARHLRLTLVDFFRQYIASFSQKDWRGNRQVRTDEHVWEAFRHFASRIIMSTNPSKALQEVFRYESTVNELVTMEPLPEDRPTLSELPRGQSFALVDQARVFRTQSRLPWIRSDGDERSPGRESCFLLFVTRDRLCAVEIGTCLADALAILAELNQVPSQDHGLHRRLFEVLEPLRNIGVFRLLESS